MVAKKATPMHPYDIFLILSVACVISFMGVIHVDDNLKLALGFVAAAVIGCPLGAWAFWRFVPMHDQLAVILGAFAGGVVFSLVNRGVSRGR